MPQLRHLHLGAEEVPPGLARDLEACTRLEVLVLEGRWGGTLCLLGVLGSASSLASRLQVLDIAQLCDTQLEVPQDLALLLRRLPKLARLRAQVQLRPPAAQVEQLLASAGLEVVSEPEGGRGAGGSGPLPRLELLWSGVVAWQEGDGAAQRRRVAVQLYTGNSSVLYYVD